MLTAYVHRKGKLVGQQVQNNKVPPGCVWIDLLRPTAEEERLVGSYLGLEMPTREDMVEIEASSRVYSEDDALFMTAILLAHTDSAAPETTPVTFIRSHHPLVTIRLGEPRSIETFIVRAQKVAGAYGSADAVLIGLLESIIDRSADILEVLGLGIESLSSEVFEHEARHSEEVRELSEILRNIGRQGNLNSKARESLISLGRVFAVLSQDIAPRSVSSDLRARLKTASHDLSSLTEHSSFLSNKLNFLLDATLGMVNIEQNATIKTFTVAAVVFLPPTLIASVYGMNFDLMPELHWRIGYPLALGAMVASAILPYVFFKWRRWL